MVVPGQAVSEENGSMSIASPFDTDPSDIDVESLRALLFRPVETTAFWAAVALPIAYPALMIGGLDGRELFFLVATFVLHVVTLRLGRGHGRDT